MLLREIFLKIEVAGYVLDELLEQNGQRRRPSPHGDCATCSISVTTNKVVGRGQSSRYRCYSDPTTSSRPSSGVAPSGLRAGRSLETLCRISIDL